MEHVYRILRFRTLEVFQLADKDQNGWLSKNELKSMLQKHNEIRWELRTAGGRPWNEFWDELDANDDGKIQLDELEAYMAKVMREKYQKYHDGLKSRAEQIFKIADLDGNGWLSRTELKKALHADPELRDELFASHGRHWKDFWAELDADGDSKIVLQELVDYITNNYTRNMDNWLKKVGAEEPRPVSPKPEIVDDAADDGAADDSASAENNDGEEEAAKELPILPLSLWEDGKATLAERIKALRAASSVLFDRADKNGDGELSKNELKKVIQGDFLIRFVLRMSGGRRWFDFWDTLDENDDGTIQLEELAGYIVKIEFERVAELVESIVANAKAIADAGDKDGATVKDQLKVEADISDDLRSAFGRSWEAFFDGVPDAGVTAAAIEDYIRKAHQAAVDECDE